MRRTAYVRRFFAGLAAVAVALAASPSWATPALTIDVASGEVLYEQDATQPWFPASTTKLMTVYVALSAVRDGKISMDTPLVLSARAHHVPPSKMGFPVGTQVTLDNALKMLMVRSANDIAIVVAEGISGSVEAFADDMNRAGAELGLHESHFVNPNGLPDADHYSSARDMALIGRALYGQFPQYASLFNIGALALGPEIITNHNNLLGRYPGADGMKTGFTCAAGFNVVASAYRDGRRLLVVVFGAPSVAARTQKVAALFDRGFAGVDRPVSSIVALAAAPGGAPPDMHDQVCRNRTALLAKFDSEVEQLDAPLAAPTNNALGLPALNPERSLLFSSQAATVSSVPTATLITTMPPPAFNPVVVHIGAEPGYSGAVAQARAPHSAIGSEPTPASVEAYATTAPGVAAAGPLGVDANALPMHGRHGRMARLPHRGRTLKAAAEAPSTKVLADTPEGDGASKAAPPAAKTKVALKAKTVVAPKTAARKVATSKAVAKTAKTPKPAVKTAAKKVRSAAGE